MTKTKIRKAFANNRWTDIKFIKAQVSTILHSRGSFDSRLVNLGKNALANIAIPLATDNLPRLVTNLISSAINKFDRKISGTRTVRAGKRFTVFILNEDMNNIIIKIVKRLEGSNVLIGGVTETTWSFFTTFSRVISIACNFFSSKRYRWKRS